MVKQFINRKRLITNMTNLTHTFEEEVQSEDNFTETEKEEIIQQMNDKMARLMVPATVYISVLMVFGLFGNLMVCYYYGFHIKRTTNSFFIVVLALYDVVVCSICMPTEIVDIELNYTFENNAACKILRFVNYLAGIGSILTLIAIATDRFKKVCKPVKPQMSMTTAKRISFAIFGVALLLSWPSLAIYGSIKVPIPNDLGIELKGSDCTSTKDKKYRGYVWAFNIVHFVMFFVCSVILIVVYSVIGRSIYLHHQRLRQYTPKPRAVSSTTETSLSKETQEETVEESKKSTSDTITDTRSEKEQNNKFALKKILSKPLGKKTSRHSAESSIDSETLKLTMIMIIVTFVFIISFLPYLSLTVWRIKQGKHEAEFLSGEGLVGFKIGSRSFLLNSSLNPWIYGIFNSSFRRFFFDLFLCRRTN